MNDNQKFLSGLLLGVAAGATTVALLQSKCSKAIVKNVKSSVKNVTDNLKDKLSRLDATIDSWINKGRNFVNGYRSNTAKNEVASDFEEYFC